MSVKGGEEEEELEDLKGVGGKRRWTGQCRKRNVHYKGRGQRGVVCPVF